MFTRYQTMYTVLIVLLACACEVTFSQKPINADLQEFAKKNHQFSANIYKEINQVSNGKTNFFVSPLSLQTVLAGVAYGAKGRTRSQIQSILGYPYTFSQRHELIMAFSTLHNEINKLTDSYKLLTANKLYVKNGVTLESTYANNVQKLLDVSVENIDIMDPLKASQTINNWVREQTDGFLHHVIDPSQLSEETVLILVNALYFSANWQNQFDEANTRMHKFCDTENNCNLVPTMFNTFEARYAIDTDLGVQFLEMPYYAGNNPDVSMVIVLPNNVNNLAAVEGNITKILNSEPDWISGYEIDLSLPKFSISSSQQLKEILQNLNVTRVFTRGAQLTMTQYRNLYVTSINQEALIKVTESGTEAAAATAVNVGIRFGGDESKVVLRVDHSFLFYIKWQNIILFVGKVASL